MSRFLTCLRCDLRMGRRIVGVGMALAAFVAAFVTLGLWMKAASMELPWRQFTLGDNIMAVLGGMLPVQGNEGAQVLFPVGWLLFIAASVYAPLAFASLGKGGYSDAVALRSGNRWSWFLARCLWVVLATLCFWAAFFAVEALLTLATSGDMSLWAEEVRGALGLPEYEGLLPAPYDLASFCLMAPFASCAFCLLASVVALVLKPVCAFVAVLALAILPIMTVTGVFPGEYLMAVRCEEVIADGFTTTQAALFDAALAAGLVIAGGCFYLRQDLMGGARDDD